MNRKDFINLLISGALSSSVVPVLFSCKDDKKDLPKVEEYIDETEGYTDKITFGVCADVHQDYFYGMPDRLKVFVDEANRRKVDFIIQLGDFCFPLAANDKFMSVWNSFNGPKYHVIGNHDCERSSKKVFMDYVGYPGENPWYSFDIGGYHFVVLDVNFGMKNGVMVPFEKHNGSGVDTPNYINDEQYDWLAKDLAKTNKRTVLFSHQTLNKDVKNPGRLNDILRDANRTHRKVFATFSGHRHQDWQESVNNIYHCQVNSMCFYYIGKNYLDWTRYPAEIYDKYPIMAQTIPYKDPLFAIVELDPVNKTIKITGRESTFVGSSPTEMGVPNPQNISSSIADVLLRYK